MKANKTELVSQAALGIAIAEEFEGVATVNDSGFSVWLKVILPNEHKNLIPLLNEALARLGLEIFSTILYQENQFQIQYRMNPDFKF